MQYITNTSKGGISYVANNLEPIYGRVSNRKSIFTCIDSLVTHYDRDLARALLLSLFGITAGIKIHIVHVNPINLTKFKFVNVGQRENRNLPRAARPHPFMRCPQNA